MRLARSLAIGISELVVKFASPGCKEWAEGLAREIVFIESDWAALRWALGSTRVLLDRRRAPFASLADAEVAAKKFINRRQQWGFFWVIWLFNACITSLGILRAHNWSKRIGIICMTMSYAYIAFVTWSEQHRWKMLFREYGENHIALYKAELERGLDNFRTWRFWLSIFGMVLLFLGIVMDMPEDLQFWLVFEVLVVLSVAISGYYQRRTYRRYLQRLEELSTISNGSSS